MSSDKELLGAACFYSWLLFSGCSYERLPFMDNGMNDGKVCGLVAYILCLPALNLLHTVASLSVLHLLLEVFCLICIPGLQVIERFVLQMFKPSGVHFICHCF